MFRRGLLIMVALMLILGGNAAAQDRPAWQGAYRHFITSQNYTGSISSVIPEYREMFRERDTEWDAFAMFDLDRNGIPELFIRTDAGGIEQLDVFTCDGSRIIHTGTAGGENFFQAVIRYEDSRYPGVYALIGGPVMEIEEYTLSSGKLRKREIGRTTVDWEGEETTGITMQVSDPPLQQLLMGTLVSGENRAETLVWCLYKELMSEDYWDMLYMGFTEPMILR